MKIKHSFIRFVFKCFGVGFVFSMILSCNWIPKDPVPKDQKSMRKVDKIKPAIITEALPDRSGSPTIWIHSKDSSKSLVFGINKAPYPKGGFCSFDLEGKIKQAIQGLDWPNSIDLEHGFVVGKKTVDILVLAEQSKKGLRAFFIHPETGHATDATGNMKVFDGDKETGSLPSGIALYRRPSDHQMFVFVSRKSGKKGSQETSLCQYLLKLRANHQVDLVKIRELGPFSGAEEMSAVAVDAPLGYVYCADISTGIRKSYADPGHPGKDRELTLFGEATGFYGDRTGLAIYPVDHQKGYLISVNNMDCDSRFFIYRREGEKGYPHNHSRILKVIRAGTGHTDSIATTSTPLGKKFPKGILVANNNADKNNKDKNFYIFDWKEIEDAGDISLADIEYNEKRNLAFYF